MKTIGLIGGMSWESTVTYYQILNQTVKQQLGGLHSAKILLYSVDFAQIEEQQITGQWEESAKLLGDAAEKLEKAGADLLLICTNTMHKVAPQVRQRVSIPLLHIAELTADALTQAGITKVGLLGSTYTMKQDFYKAKIQEAGIDVVIPNESDMEMVNHVIFHELCMGIISEESRQKYAAVIADLKERGAQGVILGCTEIGLLVTQADSPLPVFDTTRIHAEKAALFAIG